MIARYLLDQEAADVSEPGTAFRFSGVSRFVPLLVTGGVFAASILLALFGPIDWLFPNPVAVYGFLAACFLALVAGYLLATLGKERPAQSGVRQINLNALMVAGAIAYLLLFPFVTQVTTGKWYPDVVGGLTNAGEAYANAKRLNQENSPLVLYLRMLLGPLTLPILPVTLFLWKRLNPLARAAGITCTLLGVALNASQGTANGVAEMCGVAVLFFSLVAVSSFNKAGWRRALQALAAIAVTVALFLGYYSLIMNSRLSADIENDSQHTTSASREKVAASMANAEGLGAVLRRDSIYYLVVPGGLQPLGILLDNYLTQGYRGLSLAMQEPFTPSYGMGFSEFYRHNLLKISGQSDREPAVVAATYAGKIGEKGWPVGERWGSFFIHPASDLTFPGVVVLMLIIGLGFGLSWRDLVTRGDPLAATVFVQFCLLVFYLCANNQLFQGGERAIGFTVLLVAWLVLRSLPHRKSNWTAVETS